MSTWTDIELARAALADPALPPAELAPIAAAFPQLWPQVAAHPAIYPELRAWLVQQGVPAAAPSPSPGAVGPAGPGGPGGSASPWGARGFTQPQGPLSDGAPGTALGAKPPRKNVLRVVLVVTAVVVLVAAAVAVGWTVTRPSNDRPVASRTIAVADPTSDRSAPAASRPSAKPPAVTRSAVATPERPSNGTVAVLPSTTPVPIKAGEALFRGTVDKSGITVEVGFIRSSDGRSIHSATLALSGDTLQDEYGATRVTHFSSGLATVVDGRATVPLTGDLKLSLEITGDSAHCVVPYDYTLGGFANVPKKELDLGDVELTLATV